MQSRSSKPDAIRVAANAINAKCVGAIARHNRIRKATPQTNASAPCNCISKAMACGALPAYCRRITKRLRIGSSSIRHSCPLCRRNRLPVRPSNWMNSTPSLRRKKQNLRNYFATKEPAGTLIVDTPNTYLYYVLGGGRAIRYGVRVGRDGFTWTGVQKIIAQGRVAGLASADRR